MSPIPAESTAASAASGTTTATTASGATAATTVTDGPDGIEVTGPVSPAEPPPAEPAAPRSLTRLDHPADGVPPVVDTHEALDAAVAAVGAGTGPVAIDAERASGYRYGQRAYLVQVRREGAGTWLIDPVACPDLSALGEAIGDGEWILHAATQDLPCLTEVGLRPAALFDTELGGRLAGQPRVGLAAMVEHYLGLSLAKEHSAVDWSTRPLPEPWLRYAALDVEVLGELRDAVAADLEQQGKSEWARQEFEALLTFSGPAPRTDPWRRTSGVHRIRTRRGLAMVRQMWLARDEEAQSRDVSPGRVLPDGVIAALAQTHQRAQQPPRQLSVDDPRLSRSLRRHEALVADAIEAAFALPESDLPVVSLPSTGPPPIRSWADREPHRAAALADVRAALGELAETHRVPVENLLSPDVLRRLLWTWDGGDDAEAIGAQLATMGARPWQVELTAPLIAVACRTHPLG